MILNFILKVNLGYNSAGVRYRPRFLSLIIAIAFSVSFTAAPILYAQDSTTENNVDTIAKVALLLPDTKFPAYYLQNFEALKDSEFSGHLFTRLHWLSAGRDLVPVDSQFAALVAAAPVTIKDCTHFFNVVGGLPTDKNLLQDFYISVHSLLVSNGKLLAGLDLSVSKLFDQMTVQRYRSLADFLASGKFEIVYEQKTCRIQPLFGPVPEKASFAWCIVQAAPDDWHLSVLNDELVDQCTGSQSHLE